MKKKFKEIGQYIVVIIIGFLAFFAGIFGWNQCENCWINPSEITNPFLRKWGTIVIGALIVLAGLYLLYRHLRYED